MTDHTTPSSQYDHDQAVHTLALDLCDNESSCRRLAYFLLRHASVELIEAALEHDALIRVKIDEYMTERVQRLAELEAERAKFSDPNHPGE